MEETREAEDAFWCVLGYSQEYLDRVHRKADEYRETVLAAGGRIGPQMSLEEGSAVSHRTNQTPTSTTNI